MGIDAPISVHFVTERFASTSGRSGVGPAVATRNGRPARGPSPGGSPPGLERATWAAVR